MDTQALACPSCDLGFPVDEGSVDFTRGRYYDEFPGPETLSREQLQGLKHEVVGTTARIEDFYHPLLRSKATHRGVEGEPSIRVLDSGCGNGISVDLLNHMGFEAWGNDVSALRKWQWRERHCRRRLVVADTRKLPFPNGYFDFVLSSGVLEHIGVKEEGGTSYTVRPLPERDLARIEFLRELLRVVASHGLLFLDFPNGAFPVDFWHGITPGGARFHGLAEGFLPKVREVRSYVEEIGSYSVSPMSPYRRLRMRQVARHWYGRILRWPMTGLLWSMELPPFRFLTGSCLNPYLVLEVGRKG